MSDIGPLGEDDIVIYSNDDHRNPLAPHCVGFFQRGGEMYPMYFYGSTPSELKSRMVSWLYAEREKLAEREATLTYLRSPEAIAERQRKAAETRAAKKAATP